MAIWAWALIDRFRGERMRGRMGNAPIRPRIFWYGFCNQTVGQDSKPGFCRNSVKTNMRGKNVNIYKRISSP